jgi:predicted transcriptional regulator
VEASAPTEDDVTKPVHDDLSRRERQIVDVLYRLGAGSVTDVVGHLGNVSYGSVRVTLSILESKGYVRHRREGRRYIYAPVVAPDVARESALSHLTQTFFSGSPHRAVLALLEASSGKLSDQDLDEIESWIDEARDQGSDG